MNDSTRWTEADLFGLIENQTTESISLDYKECGALQKTEGKKNELSKDVSAFANSAGGLLVYGMKENGHVPIELDFGFDPNDITKEWIEQVINSRISRRIDGVRVHPISLTGSRCGRVAYVVEVPTSARAPHMASDRRFYKRFNFESVPMEEYEVRDVSRRFVAPDLQMGLIVSLQQPNRDETCRGAAEFFVVNRSDFPADYALITYYVSTGLQPSDAGVKGTDEQNTIISGDTRYSVRAYKREWRGASRLPLMRGARYQVNYFCITIAGASACEYVFWEILAPGSEPKRGAMEIRRVGETVVTDQVNLDWKLAEERLWEI